MTVVVEAVLAGCFPAPVFIASGKRRWKARFEELTWIVDVERLPYGDRFGIGIGVWLRASGGDEPKTSNKCPLIAVPENLPLEDAPEAWLIVQALDLASANADGQRVELIESIGRAVAGFITTRADAAALRQAYARGDFRSSFVHKDLRGYLEGGPAKPIIWPTPPGR